MTITQNIFDKLLPTFAAPDGFVFEKITPYLERAESLADELLSPLTVATVADAGNDTLKNAAYTYVCKKAARDAVPSLDLVLTPTGFGVVSNDQTAPASRERVDALLESLILEESETRHTLVNTICADNVNYTYKRACELMPRLIYDAGTARAHGCKLDGKTVYEDEFEMLRPRLETARLRLARFISMEQMEALEKDNVALLRSDMTVQTVTAIYYAALWLTDAVNGASPATLDKETRYLLHLMEKNIAVFPAYADSSERAAHEIFYSNAKEDKTFFFG